MISSDKIRAEFKRIQGLGFSFEKMIEGIKNGYVKFEVRYGVNKSGPKIGKKHDHGCGFRVTLKNLSNLFDTFVEVE